MRWLRKRLSGLPWKKMFLYGSGGLIALIACFYTEEDIRGKRAWEKYRQELAAKGEQLDVASLILSPVPDESNFAKASILIGAYPTNAEFYATHPDWPRTTNAVDRLTFSGFAPHASAAMYSPNWALPSNGCWRESIKTDLRE